MGGDKNLDCEARLKDVGIMLYAVFLKESQF